MQNLILGLQNIAANLHLSLLAILHHQLVWGFALGFLASTIVHLLVMIENPRDLPRMICRSATECFQIIAKKDALGTYLVSYTEFQKDYNRVRIAAYSVLCAFLLVVAITLLRY